MTGDRLYQLAGSSVAALHLLRAADGDFVGTKLDRTLTIWSNLGCGSERGMLYVQLRDRVEAWKRFEDDPICWTDWDVEQMDAEVLGALFPLVHGQQPCRGRCCLNGSLLAGLDAIRPVGHQTASAAA